MCILEGYLKIFLSCLSVSDSDDVKVLGAGDLVESNLASHCEELESETVVSIWVQQ